MKPPAILQASQPVWLFDGVPEHLVEEVFRRVEFQQKGHVLFREDQKADAFYYIKHGDLDLLRENTILVSRHPGWAIGEQAFIENVQHSITAVVTSPTAEVCRIEKSLAEKLLNDVRFVLNMLKMVSQKLSQTTYETCVRYRHEELLFREFRSHVAPTIATELLKRGINYGQPRYINGVVLFSDIRDFTLRSGTMTPEGVAHELGAYLDRMVELVHKHGGLVDKFIGDAIMAIWGYQSLGGDTASAEDVACQALSCAREMVQSARVMMFGGHAIRIGIGIEYGKLFIGSVGTGDKKQFTVLGQVANLASRNESLSKDLACDIVLGDSIYGFVNLPGLGIEAVAHKDKEVKGAGHVTVHSISIP